eukprot:TRINITY_DN2187_c0_g1_i7.p1 TRINITY_DN2187_c0_g1~~TRINITY_DN2187_c0_g1_i7.p1  ORF type:complete len:150 (-),score=30.68 TRINITY_DN2187_c0_g1_i7:214-663(-)
MSDSKIFVGKLAKNVEEKDLKKAFEKFGEVKSIEMKHSFAFIEFEGGNAAEDAIKEMNGKELDGSEIRVEKYGENKKEGRTRGPRNEDTCYNCGRKGHWEKIIQKMHFLASDIEEFSPQPSDHFHTPWPKRMTLTILENICDRMLIDFK